MDTHRRRRICAGGIAVDLGARQARVDDRLLELTALEFDLLAYLVERPGQVFSRDQLLRAVWRSTAEWQQAATVTEHIRRLRTKIEAEPHHPRVLRTVRGAGYRLDRLEQRSTGFDSGPEPVLQRPDGSGGAAVMDDDTGYRALFERSADSVLVADDDGAYVDANPAAVRMLGVDRDDLIGRRVADFVVDEVASIEHHWSTFVASGGESGRVRIRRGDGEVIVCDYNATANFVPGRHLSILRDVTDMVEAQRRRESSALPAGVG